jgi:cell division protein FtsW (lipid II flippase)
MRRGLLFPCLAALVVLAPAPAYAQVNFLDSTDCGILGIPCTGNETEVELGNRINYFTDAFIILLSTVAVIFLVYAGYKYITSAGNEEAAVQAKRQIIYAVLGVIVARSAYIIRGAVQTTALFSPDQAAISLRLIADPFIELALFLIGTVATIYLIYAGYKYISSRGDYEASETAKRQIVYALVGIVVAAGARIISSVFIVVSGSPAATLGVLTGPGGLAGTSGQDLVDFVVPVVNATLALAGVAAAAYMVMAGVMYFSAEGDEQQAETAKRQLIYGVIGIAVILLSAAIVNFIILAVV